MRMPWERPGQGPRRHLAELLEDDDDDNSLPPLDLALGSAQRGTSVDAAPASMHSLSSPSTSTTYQIVPRGGGSGGYEAVAMRPTSLPAGQLSALLLGAPHIHSTAATEGSASSEENSASFSPTGHFTR